MLKLRPGQKKVTANMISLAPLQFGRDLPLAPIGVVPIPKGELTVINIDPHNKKEKGFVPVPSSSEIMRVHPDIVKSQQRTTVTNWKSKGKGNASSCNMVCTFSTEAKIDVASIIDSEEEEIIPATLQSAPPMARTRPSQQYLEMYDEVVPSPFKQAKEAAKQFTKQPVEKKKELRYAKALQKDKAGGSSTPFH